MLITGHSSHTIAAYYSIFRTIILNTLVEEDTIIGGDGIIVELDESKFGKIKYNLGHRVEGVWVFGGVERTENRKMFLKIVEKRNEETLIDLIKTHIKPNSIIISDCWKSYDKLGEIKGYEIHFKVNHSQNYVDPISGAHTNSIEGTWNGIKQGIKPRNRTKKNIEEYLLEFIWRRQNANNLWDAFLNAMKQCYMEYEGV